MTTHGIRRASHRERFQPLAFVTLALRGQRALEKRGVILQNDQTMKSLQSPAGKRLTEKLALPKPSEVSPPRILTQSN